MKTKFIFSIAPTLLVLLMLAGSQNVSAADVRLNVGVGGGHHYYGDHQYRTHDGAYDTWYSDTPSYSYYDNSAPATVYSDTTYVDPYVYSTPSVGFNSWYGGGYYNHNNSNYNNNYSGGSHGYSGGNRGGYSSGNSGGGHSGGGHSGGGHSR